jgi:environmental stress-induced protein Ves
MHRLLQPADYVRMPWKNGGGRTSEIALYPPDATSDAFDWRVSVADVAANGPFSRFPGVDRTIVLIAGAGMRLDGDGHAAELRTPFEPYAFSGDDAIVCTLLAGPVRDFNLMLRRGRARGHVAVVRDEGMRIAPARFVVCYAAAGALECLLPAHSPVTLASDHALTIEDEGAAVGAPIAINPLSGDAVALVAAIELLP